MKAHDPEKRLAVLEAVVEKKHSPYQFAKEHGIGRSTVLGWIAAHKKGEMTIEMLRRGLAKTSSKPKDAKKPASIPPAARPRAPYEVPKDVRRADVARPSPDLAVRVDDVVKWRDAELVRLLQERKEFLVKNDADVAKLRELGAGTADLEKTEVAK